MNTNDQDTASGEEFTHWLMHVLTEGQSVQTKPPPTVLPQDAVPILKAGYDRAALDVAGSLIEWNVTVCAQAALTLAQACWFVASGADDAQVELPGEPSEASAHLSADVALRLLPMVYRRAKARAAESPLTQSLIRVFRAWPLSGVLADLNDPPTASVSFAGHPGLQMLYAERLVLQPRAEWLPPDGPAREWVERIFQERGRTLPAAVAKGTAHE